MKVAAHFAFVLIIAGILASCSGSNSNKAQANTDTIPPKKKAVLTKPGSSFSDTFRISKPSAVFYAPDSVQLEKIRSISDEGVFEATMHEFDSQFRNGHMILKKEWPQVRVINVKNARFLDFIKNNGEKVIIDLDRKDDPCGLFIFDTKKDPEFTDMMNIDTKLYYYFKK
jgi:hypothetical protein